MLRIYDLEKRSTVLENAAGFVRRDAYTYGPVTKWWHWSMFVHWGIKLRVHQKHCMSWNATSAEFLEVQIPPCVLVYDLVS